MDVFAYKLCALCLSISTFLFLSKIAILLHTLTFKMQIYIHSGSQKSVRRARAGEPALKISNHRVIAVEDDEDNYDLEEWIFPTLNGGLSNWEAKDFVPINFIQ